jgi:hypothetical protein
MVRYYVRRRPYVLNWKDTIARLRDSQVASTLQVKCQIWLCSTDENKKPSDSADVPPNSLNADLMLIIVLHNVEYNTPSAVLKLTYGR